jgi:hypothetical protein
MILTVASVPLALYIEVAISTLVSDTQMRTLKSSVSNL